MEVRFPSGDEFAAFLSMPLQVPLKPGAASSSSSASPPSSSSSSALAGPRTTPSSAIDLTPWAATFASTTDGDPGLAFLAQAPLIPPTTVDFCDQPPPPATAHFATAGSNATTASHQPSTTSGDDTDDEDDDEEDDDDDEMDQEDGGDERGTVGPSHAAGKDGAPARKTRKIRPLPPGTIICDKSCLRCRERKVKCNRVFPTCDHCEQRKEKCDLINWTPKVKKSAAQGDPGRIAHLEQRLAELESQLATKSSAPVPNNASIDFGLNGIGGPSFESSFNAILGVPPLASSSALTPFVPTTGSSPDSSSKGTSNIGAFSLDWRLATPQMAAALSRHLCEAFFESCCFVLPTYAYFRTRKNDLQRDEWMLSPALKVAIAAFRAVGARTSPHSALLGITIDPNDSRDHPNAPLLSAGTRRESACTNFLKQAHQMCFEEGLAEEVSVENLGSLMTLMQMAVFVELKPKRSRSLLRAALDQYKELHDECTTDAERTELKSTFGFGLYSADSLIAAFGQRLPSINDRDLRAYFGHIGIVIPKLPEDENLLPVLDRLLSKAKEKPESLKSVRHLLHCWICACQRDFARLASPPTKPLAEIEAGVRKLWLGVEKTRATIQVVLSVMTTQNLAHLAHDHPPSAAHAQQHHHHESDYGPQIVRLDRDLLDLINMVHAMVQHLPSPGLPDLLRDSTSKVRRGLKALAFYAKVYSCGADLHMIFHAFFNLELLPDWTTLALQKMGDVPGPSVPEEEINEQEMAWLIEGLKNACYYTPDAERRLAELSPRFTSLDQPSPPLGDLPLVTSPRSTSSGSQGTQEFDLAFSIDSFMNSDAFDAVGSSSSLFDSTGLFDPSSSGVGGALNFDF